MYLWRGRVIIGMDFGVLEVVFSSGVEFLGSRSWVCVLGGEGDRGCLCRCVGHAFGRCRQICHRAKFSSIVTREKKERGNKS